MKDSITNEYDFSNQTGKGPKGYKRADAKVLEDVNEALYMSPVIDASEIEVTLIAGCVYLRGAIETRTMKKDAERLIENIPGVNEVQNLLQVKSAEDFLSGLTGDARDYEEGLVKNQTGMN